MGKSERRSIGKLASPRSPSVSTNFDTLRADLSSGDSLLAGDSPARFFRHPKRSPESRQFPNVHCSAHCRARPLPPRRSHRPRIHHDANQRLLHTPRHHCGDYVRGRLSTASPGVLYFSALFRAWHDLHPSERGIACYGSVCRYDGVPVFSVGVEIRAGLETSGNRRVHISAVPPPWAPCPSGLC
jgi:hypothetical protein